MKFRNLPEAERELVNLAVPEFCGPDGQYSDGIVRRVLANNLALVEQMLNAADFEAKDSASRQLDGLISEAHQAAELGGDSGRIDASDRAVFGQALRRCASQLQASLGTLERIREQILAIAGPDPADKPLTEAEIAEIQGQVDRGEYVPRHVKRALAERALRDTGASS